MAIRIHSDAWVDFYYPRGTDRSPLRTTTKRSGRRAGAVPHDGVRFSKAFGGPTGSLQVRFLGPKAQKVLDLAEVGCWWRLHVARDGVEYELSAGKVDAVSVSVSGPASQLEVVVEGRDVGMVFADTPIWFNVFLQANLGGQDMARIMRGRPDGTPDELIRRIVSGMLGVDGSYGGHWRLPRGLAEAKRRGAGGPRRQGNDFEGWIRYPDPATTELRGVTVVPGLIMAPPAQSLWAFMDAWRNPPLNELWVDYIDQQPEIRMREKPFVNLTAGAKSPWFDLTTHEVSPNEVGSFQIRNGDNRVNFVMTQQDMVPFQQIEQNAIFQPVVDRQSIRDHGLRRVEETLSYFQQDQGYLFDSTEWRDLVLAWNALNHREWSGTMLIEGIRPEIRIGDRLKYLNRGRAKVPGLPAEVVFYVEAVTHSIDETPRSVTHVQVSRGYDDAKRVDDLQSAVRAWTTPVGNSVLAGSDSPVIL